MEIVKMGAKATGEIERDHWQTPRYILDLVNEFWPVGWEDPCPPNPTFNIFDKGFGYKPMYINPPFSRYKEFVNHLLGFESCPEQIWISHTNNSTGWYKQLLAAASAIVLIDHRVRFVDPATGEQSKQTAFGKSQTLFYIGPRVKQFRYTFSKLGTVLVKGEECEYCQ